jgi:mono/diheme cytochrome c family protein
MKLNLPDRRFGSGKLLFMLLAGLAFHACSKTQAPDQSVVERGKYLVAFGGCHDCHTPKIPGPGGMPAVDTAKLLAGHLENAPVPSWSPQDLQQKHVMAATNESFTAWAGPWGVSFAINLTPDKDTGIGEWSEEQFIRMARTGKHQGQPNGRAILLPMPWFDMKDLTDADLKAIWAYLRSLPPIKNKIPLPLSPAAQAPPTITPEGPSKVR